MRRSCYQILFTFILYCLILSDKLYKSCIVFEKTLYLQCFFPTRRFFGSMGPWVRIPPPGPGCKPCKSLICKAYGVFWGIFDGRRFPVLYPLILPYALSALDSRLYHLCPLRQPVLCCDFLCFHTIHPYHG